MRTIISISNAEKIYEKETVSPGRMPWGESLPDNSSCVPLGADGRQGLKHICKEFPGVKALDDVNLTLDAGEVLALVGENGAGKSTLMLTLGGVHKPEAGQIFINGKEVSFSSPMDAQSQGIGIVYQELSLVQGLSIAENIFANRQPVGKAGFIKKEELYKSAREMLELFHMEHLDPGMLVKELSVANRQVIEILKAISCDPKILVLDEPTSSLTEVEVQELFRNIRILKERGIAIIYISHHLHEIFEIADKVTILRDGKYICEARVADIDEEFLVTKMVGRKIENIYGKRQEDEKIGEVCFRAEHLERKGLFHDISFEVRKGEIVGMSGLVGAGRTEIGLAVFGAYPGREAGGNPQRPGCNRKRYRLYERKPEGTGTVSGF